jgi:hypothetical protein
MKRRHLAVWLSGAALLGTGATILCAQPPQLRREAPPGIGRDEIRAEVVRLQTDVEMLRLDYELARDGLLEDLKLRRGLKMAGGMMQFGSAIQSAINAATTQPPGAAPRREPELDPKKAAEAEKAAAAEERKEAAEEAAFIGERKKELARLFALLARRRLDLEDAERHYRESPR